MADKISLAPPKNMWFGGVFFLFMGLGSVPLLGILPGSTPVSSSTLVFLFVISQLYTVSGVRFICTAFLGRIEADNSRIHWRTRTGRRFAEWSDVTDYFEKLPSSQPRSSSGNQLQKDMWIETTHGRFLVAPYLKGDLDSFRALVRRKAVNAKTDDWSLLGTRPCDSWPRVFHYEPRKRRMAAWISGLGTIVYLALAAIILWRLCWYFYSILGNSEVHSMYRMLWLIAVWPAVILVVNCIRQVHALRQAGERIVVTPQGFEYQDKDGVSVAGEWSSVLEYYAVPAGVLWGHRYLVALSGSDEKSWSFTTEVNNAYDLLYIVRKYAPPPQLAPSTWALWPFKSDEHSISSPMGRVHSYQNRGVRALLIVATVSGAMMLFPFLLIDLLGIPPRRDDDPAAFLILLALITVPLLYNWWRYFAAGIETDDFGITQCTVFGRRRILWLAVSDYKVDGRGFCVYGKNRTPVVFSPNINQVEELKSEIERRSPTPRTGWAKAPTGNVDANDRNYGHNN